MKKNTFLTLAGSLAIAAWTLAGSSGCHGNGGYAEQRDLMVDDLAAGERPVAMKGEGAFLEGKLAATATVSRGFDRVAKEGAAHGGRSGRGGRGGGRGAHEEGDATFSDGYSIGSGGDSDEAQQEAMEDYVRLIRAQRAAGSPMPPVTLHLQFENRGPDVIEVAVTEVNSELGNFAARPEKLTIAAGASGTLDPMISQLGVSSDEIPIKVTVFSAGKKETQTISVKSILPPATKK